MSSFRYGGTWNGGRFVGYRRIHLESSSSVEEGSVEKVSAPTNEEVPMIFEWRGSRIVLFGRRRVGDLFAEVDRRPRTGLERLRILTGVEGEPGGGTSTYASATSSIRNLKVKLRRQDGLGDWLTNSCEVIVVRKYCQDRDLAEEIR